MKISLTLFYTILVIYLASATSYLASARLTIQSLVPNYPVITAITAVISAILVVRVQKRLLCGNKENEASSCITFETRTVTNRVPASRASFASSSFGACSHATDEYVSETEIEDQEFHRI